MAQSDIPSRRRKSYLAIVLAGGLLIAAALHLWSQRYYARFIPVPLSLVSWVDEDTWLLPASQAAAPMGVFDFGGGDITTEAGLRATLDRIQELSPTKVVDGMPDYTDIAFDKWVREVQAKPFYCTDATQLFILAAWRQGLMAREWHLLNAGWPAGQGHSVAEFFNPSIGSWQLVDAQHGSIARSTRDGRILAMSELLSRYYREGRKSITFDYGPGRDTEAGAGRGRMTETYFFDNNLLRAPVLQLRQATWFSSVARNWGMSGHFVIGYPVITDAWTHHPQVWMTKLSSLSAVVAGAILIVALASAARGRKANTSPSVDTA